MTLLLYMPTPSSSNMVSSIRHTIVFAMSSLRLHLILLRTQKSTFNFSLAFSQFNIIAVTHHVSAILATMKPYPAVLIAKLTDTKLMGRHHKLILSIFPLFHSCVPCSPTHSMLKKCNTGQSTNLTPTRFLMAPTTTHCLRLLLLFVMNTFQCGSSLILEILHLVY